VQNQPRTIASGDQGIRADVVRAIRSASAQTGVDFAYLMEKAAAESSFDPEAQATTSSARGLFQFIDSTWLETVDKHGAGHGLSAAANAISRNSEGEAVVDNEQIRREILALRDNPRISALMAAELANDNEASLEQALGHKVGSAELYMAHFLGAGGAAKFLANMEQNPDIEAAYLVPAAARANQAVFYEHGKALTANEVFARFAGKFDNPFPTSAAANGLAAAANPAAVTPDLAAPRLSLSPYPAGFLPERLSPRTLPFFALAILEALSIPGESDADNANEWVV
jgi:hypothetical protein